MTAAVKIYEMTATMAGTDKTSGTVRFKLADDQTVDSNNPITIPSGGDDYNWSYHKQLRMYTGGGTTFNPRFLEGVLRESEGEYDISVISDMDIRNLDRFVNAVLGIPQTHRVHLLYTENNGYVGKLRQSFGNRENVAILPLTSERDIQQITMGELQKSVK